MTKPQEGEYLIWGENGREAFLNKGDLKGKSLNNPKEGKKKKSNLINHQLIIRVEIINTLQTRSPPLHSSVIFLMTKDDLIEVISTTTSNV